MKYSKVSVSIWIWYSRSKCLRIRALVKTFHRYKKTFLASEVRKSVLEELVFAKSDSLSLVNFGFLDFADFVVVDRFLILSPILSLAASLAPSDTSLFFSFWSGWVLRLLLSII